MLGAGPPDLWDSWSKGFGRDQDKDRKQCPPSLLTRRSCLCCVKESGRQLGASDVCRSESLACVLVIVEGEEQRILVAEGVIKC